MVLSVGDSDLNKHRTILVPHLSKVYLSKHAISDGY